MSGERIETAGELDALPVGSVVVDASGEHYFAHGLPGGVQGTLWRCIHGESWRPAVMVDEATQPLTVAYRPDRDLIAEAEARGARAAADHIGDSAASSDFMAGEVSDVGISWFMAEAREWAENVDGEHVHTYQGAQDPKTGDLHLVCMRCDEVRPARSEQIGDDRG